MLDRSSAGVRIGAGPVEAHGARSAYSDTVRAGNDSRKLQQTARIATQHEGVFGQREVTFEEQCPGTWKDEKEVLRQAQIAAFHGNVELDIVDAVGLIALDSASGW